MRSRAEETEVFNPASMSIGVSLMNLTLLQVTRQQLPWWEGADFRLRFSDSKVVMWSNLTSTILEGKCQEINLN